MFTGPLSIPNLKLWLKADALALSDGDPVSSWTDSSGLANHATQASGTLQPLFKTAIVNGKPVIRFDGSNDGMACGTPLRHNTHTVFVVPILRASQTGRVFISEYTGGQCYFAVGISDSTANRGKYYTAPSDNTLEPAGADFAQDTAYVLSFAQDATPTKSYWRDGTFVGSQTGTSTSDVSTYSGIGFLNNVSPQQYFHGDLAEIIVYSGTLSPTDRKSVEQWLGTKYAVTVAP